MKVKICGMREEVNVADIASLRPDYMGFIFYESSPRNCIGIPPSLIGSLPEGIEPVMVTVDLPEDELISIADLYGFRTVQLHGKESPEMCRSLRSRGFNVIKALGMRSAESINALHEYEDTVDLLLLDTLTPSKGGSGKKFDWSILDAYDLKVPFILSGGIGPTDAEAILALKHPKFEGIDLNSRFESSPGVKNASLLHQFLTQIKINI